MPRTARVVAGLAVTTLGAAVVAAPAWGAGWVGSSAVGGPAGDTPYVAASAGSAVAAWTYETNLDGDQALMVSARAPGQTPPVGAVVSGLEAVGEPSVAANDSGTIAVGWTSTNASDEASVNLLVYRDGVLIDTDVVTPADAGDPADEAEVAVAPDGSVLLAWLADAAPLTARAVVRRPDGSLTAPLQLSSAGDAFDLEAAADGSGFITTFVRDEGEDTSVEVVRVPLAGDTTTPETLATGTVDSGTDLGDALSAPVIAAGGGRVVVAYTQETFDGASDPLTVRGATGTVAGGVGSSPVTLSGAQTQAEQPTVAAGPDGTLAVAYADGGGSTNLAVAEPRQSAFGAAQTVGSGAATRYDLGVLPNGSVLLGFSTTRLEGFLRPPGGVPASVQFADTLGVNGGTVAGDGTGNVVAAYTTPLNTVELNAYDAVGPSLGTLEVPDAGRVGQRLDFRSIGARDDWSGVAATEWTFGDGGEADGTSVTHTYQRSARFGVGIGLTDGAGNEVIRNAGTVAISEADGTPPPPGPVVGAPVVTPDPLANRRSGGADTTAPILGRLKLTRSVFRVASGSTAFAAGTRIRSGSEARFRTLEPGLARVVISRMADAAGMKSRCAAAGLPLRSKRGGTRRVRFERVLGAGTHRIRLTGRSGRKALPRGRYELRVSVADESGNRSRAQVARFTLC